jgi:hypothetical protein
METGGGAASNLQPSPRSYGSYFFESLIMPGTEATPQYSSNQKAQNNAFPELEKGKSGLQWFIIQNIHAMTAVIVYLLCSLL